jgi:hypothetical protein
MKYDILAEVERIAKRYSYRKPDRLCVNDSDWKSAREETKILLCQIRALMEPLESAYVSAFEHRDWYKALAAHVLLTFHPVLLGIAPIVCDIETRIKNEEQCVQKAKKWLDDARAFLWLLAEHQQAT